MRGVTILHDPVLQRGGGIPSNQQPLEARVDPDGSVRVDTTPSAIDSANLDGMVFVVGP